MTKPEPCAEHVPACETFTEGVVRGFCRLCGQIPADHPHGEIRDQDADADTVRVCGLCEQPMQPAWGGGRAGDVWLCHPDGGPDCYKLVTLWHYPLPDGRVWTGMGWAELNDGKEMPDGS